MRRTTIELPDFSRGFCPFCGGPYRCPPLRLDCEAAKLHDDEPWDTIPIGDA